MIEQFVIHLLNGCAVGMVVSYGFAVWKGTYTYVRIGRFLLALLAAGLVISSSMLVINIIQHQFQYTYVYNQSSREMPLHLLIASFYSGQEGSFLLWTMLVAVIAVLVMPYARRHEYENEVMVLFGAVLSFLTLLLVAKNPFALYWETFAANGITSADVPLNGRGMNPLLHNVWITIHPPILFTGFAAMTVSFVFALAGLAKKDYHNWISIALPWTLFATAVLGFGIMLGGFWAYETLGWGGFWGWDPVENSSLIPWLVSVALVHTMLVQKRTRGLVKTTFALAILSFVLVLYSTFLTRSGVLGDTSVHSFVDPGAFAFWILLAFMVLFSALGIGGIVYRFRHISSTKEEFSPSTREFMLSIGAGLILASSIFVTVGTSWPVIMEVIGKPKVAVMTNFYNQTHMVLVPLILIVNGLSLLTQWRSTVRTVFVRRVLFAFALSVCCTIVFPVSGITDIGMLIMAASAFFSLFINVQIGYAIARRSVSHAAAYISHSGIALLIFGVITTSQLSIVQHAVLVQGVPTTVGEHILTFVGKEQVEKQWTDREKYRYYVSVVPADQPNAKPTTIYATLYWSDFNRRQSAFLEPGIRWGIHNDLYLTPKATSLEDVFKATTVVKGASIRLPLDTSIVLTLERFTMPTELGSASDGRMQMAAVLRTSGIPDNEIRAITRISNGSSGLTFDPLWEPIPGTPYAVGITRIIRNNEDPDKSSAELSFRNMNEPLPVQREIFIADFAVKPWISFVWAGVITMVLGFAFSIVRYARDIRSISERKTSTTVRTIQSTITDETIA